MMVTFCTVDAIGVCGDRDRGAQDSGSMVIEVSGVAGLLLGLVTVELHSSQVMVVVVEFYLGVV